MPNQEVTLGIIGTVNIAILTTITYVYRKKLVFHLLLLFASASDLPYYIGLTVYGAFSITISDWGAVLYDIHEYKLSAMVLRKATLISINAVYISISVANFVVCYTLSDMDSYLQSPLYITSIFFQISVSFLLTFFMLNAGLKLSWRIQGAAGVTGVLDGASGAYARFTRRIRQVSVSSVMFRPNEVSMEFRNALMNLNIVMATCSLCVLLQIVMLTLNYALGYASNASKTVGPVYFYWTCYYWLPLWGMVLSLLYLSRANAPRKTFKAEVPRTAIPSFSNNAFIDGEELDGDAEYGAPSHPSDNQLNESLLDHSDSHASSNNSNYLRAGFAADYPGDRSMSKDSGLSSSTVDTYSNSQRMRFDDEDGSGLYSPDASMSFRESTASSVLSPMVDMYQKAALQSIRQFSEDI